MAKQNAEQLVLLFEKAHKAAEKAAADGTAADGEEARCLDALKTLQSMQVTTSMLVDTQVGRRLKKLAKHSRPKIAERARMLVEDWRILITTENSAKKGSPAVSKSKKPDSGPPVPLTPVWESPALKTPQIQKTGSDARDRLAQQLMEALLKVRQDVDPEVRQIVERRDVARVAGDVEKSVFSKLGLSTGVHKAKIRSIMFNLKDAKNPDFRRRVLFGEIQPEQLVTMSVEDMASDVRKLENKQIKEKALFECERGLKQAASTDQFKCGKCGQRKTTYFQMQIRSADEPMTTFITCVNCNNRWKMN
eukprot:TRINITY_DN1695_c0_g1_i1.p1 TRINITY_DN1695_c0_g1~~TRINITY_DN1695_c0_g1_i1.p1  ORF type:complete len:306 (-),score=77.11 TRINITY_DN1695_c0_g1_i1:874-1791(-)